MGGWERFDGPSLTPPGFRLGERKAVMREPDFFLVGAPKCGTTALYTYLSAHPEVFMSSPKEPGFFAEDILGDQRHTCSRDEYLRCFAAARHEKRVGEASVAYLGSASAPKAIKAFNPSAQIIVMLRNPVDMMYALHSERLFNNREDNQSFEAALDAEDRLPLRSRMSQDRRGFGLPYRESARFRDQVARYFDIFGRENVHVISYDDLRRDTAGIYRETLQFLGVHRDFQPDFPVVNPHRRARSRALQDFLRCPPEAVRAVRHALMPRPLRKLLWTWLFRLNVVYEARPPMDPALRTRLQKEFEPEVQQLGRLVGRDLSGWHRV
jgi:Sulfotransferase domain